MSLRADLEIVASLVAAKSRVLDVGCGDGELIDWLVRHKACDARGIEISREGVSAAVARGLSVIQGDADRDLAEFPGGNFDIAVLSQTLQATQRPAQVLGELLRIAKRAIVSVPNFAHWRARLQLLTGGRMPVTRSLPGSWHETENIHLCTLADFGELCASLDISIERMIPMSGGHAMTSAVAANWRAEQAIYLLRR
jgi:methionine biosynthesis protein MetW